MPPPTAPPISSPAPIPPGRIDRLNDNRGFAGGNQRRLGICPPQVSQLAICRGNQSRHHRSKRLAGETGVAPARPPPTAAVQPKVMLWPREGPLQYRRKPLAFPRLRAGHGLRPDRHRLIQSASREIDFPSVGCVLILRPGPGRSGKSSTICFSSISVKMPNWVGGSPARRPHRLRPDAAPTRHQYGFHDDYRYYFYLERNRWLLLATYYKTPTLLLLLPAILAMEMGQTLFRVAKRGGGGKSWRRGHSSPRPKISPASRAAAARRIATAPYRRPPVPPLVRR